MMNRMSLRVRNPNVWQVKALALGILREVEEVITPAVLDDEGNVVIPAVTETNIVPAEGLDIVELPPVYSVKPTFDADGNMTDPGQTYPQQHYDLSTVNPATAQLLQDIYDSAINGNSPAQANKAEVAYRHGGVEILDLSTVSSREHVFL